MLGGEKARGLPTAGQTSDCGRGCEPTTGRDAGQGDSLLPSLFASLTEGQGRRDVSKTHFTFVSKKKPQRSFRQGKKPHRIRENPAPRKWLCSVTGVGPLPCGSAPGFRLCPFGLSWEEPAAAFGAL